MKLYFMRHGEAAAITRGEFSGDSQRPLTDRGRRDICQVIDQHIADLGGLGFVLTSPYLRARQTAELVIERLEAGGQGFSGELLVCDQLVPESNLATLAAAIEGLNKSEGLNASSVLMATHQPFIGDVLSTLLDNHQWRGVDTANLVALETEALIPGFGTLLWSQMPGAYPESLTRKPSPKT